MPPCRQTVVLMESSHESCSAEEAGGRAERTDGHDEAIG